MPESVCSQFASWCRESENPEEVEMALKDEWDAIPIGDKAGSREWESRLAALKAQLGTEHTVSSKRKRAAFIPAVASMVLIMFGLMTAEFFIVRDLSQDNTVSMMTSESTKGMYTLPDGSKLWLNVGSSAEYSTKEWERGNRAVTLVGEGLFDVVQNKTAPFCVKVGSLNINVLGTRFVASYRPLTGVESVTLQRGQIYVTSDISDSVSYYMSPNQNLSFDMNSGSYVISNVEASNHTNWIHDAVSLDNMKIEDIITNIKHWYNVDIKLAEDVDREITLSFTLQEEPLYKVLDLIEDLAHLKCEVIDSNNIIINNS